MATLVEMKQQVNGDMSKRSAPFDEALLLTGGKKYMTFHSLVSGVLLFCGLVVILTPSYIIPTADCDLKFSTSEKGLLSSAGYTGMIFSSHLVGYFADSYGRRTVVITCSAICSFLTALAGFSTNFWMLYTIWVINGFHTSGIISPTYVYIAEFTPVHLRATALLISSSIASLALAFLPGMAWLILPLDIKFSFIGLVFSPWRLLILIMSLLPLFNAIMLSFFPESPKFLLTTGKPEKSLDVLKSMFSFNTGNNREDFPIQEVCLDAEDEGNSANQATSILDFFRSLGRNTLTLITPPLLLYTILSSFLQFGIVGVFNVILLLMPDTVNRVTSYAELNPWGGGATVCQAVSYQPPIIATAFEYNATTHLVNSLLSDDPYISLDINSTLDFDTGDGGPCLEISSKVFFTNMLIGMSQFIFFLFASYITPVVGRKNFLVGNLLAASLSSCLLTVLTQPYLIYIAMGVIVNTLGASLPLAVSIGVGFYPTYIRSIGTAMFMLFGRIGVVAATQFFSFIQQIYCDACYYTLTAILAGIAIITILIPVQKK